MGQSYSLPPKAIDGLGTTSAHLSEADEHSIQRLKQLIRANHFTYRLLSNPNAHVLGSAFFLGASAQRLTDVYETMASQLTSWPEQDPLNLSDMTWASHFGDHDFEHQYFNYFGDLVHDSKDQWRKVARKYLFTADPESDLWPGLFGGNAQALVHLGYTFELDSPELAIEAFSLMALEWQDLRPYYVRDESVESCVDPEQILNEIRTDSTLDTHSLSGQSVEAITLQIPDKIKFYVNRLDCKAPVKILARSLLRVVTLTSSQSAAMANCLLVLHALLEVVLHPDRVIATQHVPELVAAFWHFCVATYIGEGRPEMHNDFSSEVSNRSWKEVLEFAHSQSLPDAAILQTIRTLLFAESFCHDSERLYLQAASRLCNV